MALAVLLLLLLSWALQVGQCQEAGFWGAALQSCQGGRMRILLTPRARVASSVIRLLDPTGTPRLLRNDSACGTSVASQPDGSVAVETAFGGCYTQAQDRSYRTTVQIEGVRPDGQKITYKEELRCPEPRLVLDPPSPSRCSEVQLADRLPCSSHRLSHGRCSHLGCCFDPQDRVTPCYYGKAVTARCTPEGSFSLAVSRDTVVPPLRLDSLHLLGRRGGPCGPLLRNEAFVVFNFPLSACGTTFKEVGGQQIYENELSAERRTLHASSGSVTRDGGFFRLTICCSYSAQEPLPVSVLVATPPPPAAIAQRGTLAMDMRVARDETFSSFYGALDFPVAKLLSDPIHLEVRLLGRRDPALVLLLHECWATPGTSPLRAPQWPLLQNGCPSQGDNYQAQLVPLQWDAGLPFPSHHQRFVVRTFAFVGADSRQMLSGPIYFHCSASTCVPSAQEPCGTRCEAGLQGRRRRDAQEGAPSEAGQALMLTSAGPVDFFGLPVQASRPEGSGALALEGSLGWEDGLCLAAGLVAALGLGLLVLLLLLRRHGGQMPRGREPPYT